MHLSLKHSDGFNKLFNLIICAREAGKTSELEYYKVYKTIKKGFGVIILMRYAKEVNKLNLINLQERINQYLNKDEQIKIDSVAGSSQNGIIKFKISQNKTEFTGEGLIIWIGLDEQILKNQYIKNPKYIIFDEYIVNPQSKEKYITNEFNKILILYGTIKRYKEENTKIKIYFCGNPYSKLNPFIEYFHIDKRKLKEGALIYKDNYLIWCYKLKKELKEKLLRDDINYKFDESYKAFALDGQYIYENKIINILNYVPQFFKLEYIISILDNSFKNRNLGIFYNTNFKNSKLEYCIKEIDIKNVKKPIYSFNFENMNNAILINHENKEDITDLAESLANGLVGFVDSFYYINDLFNSYSKKI